jgi:hypothetical protein
MIVHKVSELTEPKVNSRRNEIKASHVAFISQPEAVAELILKAAQSAFV